MHMLCVVNSNVNRSFQFMLGLVLLETVLQAHSSASQSQWHCCHFFGVQFVRVIGLCPTEYLMKHVLNASSWPSPLQSHHQRLPLDCIHWAKLRKVGTSILTQSFIRPEPLNYFLCQLLKNVAYTSAMNNAKTPPHSVQKAIPQSMTCLTFLSVCRTMCLQPKACVAA